MCITSDTILTNEFYVQKYKTIRKDRSLIYQTGKRGKRVVNVVVTKWECGSLLILILYNKSKSIHPSIIKSSLKMFNVSLINQ